MATSSLMLTPLLLLTLTSDAFPVDPVAQGLTTGVAASTPKWRVPTYQGLTLSKSTRGDLVRKFGKPEWVGNPEDEYDNPVKSLIKYNYENVGGFKGKTWVVMNRRTGVIIGVELYPSEDNRISRQQVIERYGTDYVERDDRLGPCPTARELRRHGPPAKMEPLIFMVYPGRGLYVTIDYDYTVREIVYSVSCP